MNLYKKCNAKPYSFLDNDTTLVSDNPLPFNCNLLERIWKLIMTINDKISDEKLQHDTNKEAAKISALLSGKMDKYEYLTCKEIMPSNQCRIIELAKFTYSSLGEVLEEQIKTTEDQGRKQIDATMNQNERQVALINNGGKTLSYQEIFKNLFKKDLMK